MTHFQFAMFSARKMLWIGFIATLALIVALWIGPRVEYRLFPVLRNLHVVEARPTEAGMRFRLVFDKTRDCPLVGLYFYGVEESGRQTYAIYRFVDGEAIIRRPVGPQRGRLIDLTLDADAVKVGGVLTYYCGFVPWQTEYIIPLFDRVYPR